MKFRWLNLSIIPFLISTSVQAEGITEQQYSAIKHLGDLNGVALNCGYLTETQRMKKALVLALPKRRQFGEVFDTETNTAFLSFIEKKSSCPDEQTLSAEVDEAILKLDTVFAGQ
ncbi:MAG: hypothetical protein OQK42_01375 [Sedimenticola sp.]|nr:hypothetical protein [Sedimenticola sp.]MCW8948647.1 hypothetical protein [Sedimenticola sp.]MCW9021589.1 hypothetical protein [Sedimenticola sp.]